MYAIGEPTDDEQLYLEYINRARRDPAAEAARLRASTDPEVVSNLEGFEVDLDLMVQQISAFAPTAPLSFSSQLIAAARAHSQDMLAHDFQAHEGTDGTLFSDRATRAGYSWINIAENVFSYARSVEHGHAGFEVDWGGGPETGGMQDPAGHRQNIHNGSFREIGIGVVTGSNTNVGPTLVTQDFGNRLNLTPLITGVIYYDFNGNAFCDVGEGVGGVVVLPSGSTAYASSAASGGYSVPVTASSSYTVTFQVAGLPDSQSSVDVGTDNVKLDHVLAYTPPTIAGSDRPAIGQDNAYTFSTVGGAIGYQFKTGRLVASTAVEGAENGLANLTVVSTPGYAVIDNAIRASGSASFHLAHPRTGDTNSPPEDQSLTLNRTFRGRDAVTLDFSSKLNWATPQQVARAQISLDSGSTWTDVWSQAGLGNAGGNNFVAQHIPLPTVAGREFRVRFVYDYLGGGFFPDTASAVGFHVDNIGLTGADELSEETVEDLPAGTPFLFTPDAASSFALSVRAKLPGRTLPWGPAKVVTAEAGSGISIRITTVQKAADGRWQLDFTALNAGTSVFQVEQAADASGPWVAATAASVQPAGGTLYRALVLSTEPRRFYRIRAN